MKGGGPRDFSPGAAGPILAAEADQEEHWGERALCAQTDPDAFFVEKGGSIKPAKQVCSRCDVSDECLKWALDNDEWFGVLGGKSERERRKIKRERDALSVSKGVVA